MRKFYFLLPLFPAIFIVTLDAKPIAFTISNQTSGVMIFSLGSSGALHLAPWREMELTMDDRVFDNPEQSKMSYGNESIMFTYSIVLHDDVIYFDAPLKAMPNYCIKDYSHKNRFTVSLYKRRFVFDAKDPYIMVIGDSHLTNPGYIHEDTPFIFSEKLLYCMMGYTALALLVCVYGTIRNR